MSEVSGSMGAVTSSMTGTDLKVAAQRHLTALAGPHAVLREDQFDAITALVADRARAVVVQRTGWGKSAVYWVATHLMRVRGAGPTLVVSPLLALMRDQVAKATGSGLRSATINSANLDEWPGIEAALAADEIDVLLISPERLNSLGFRSRVLPNLAPRLGMLVIDEAHCISDWGNDFRPDYRRIADVLAGLPAATPVLATTATANERVTRDIAEQLGSDTVTFRGSLDRSSLALSVVPATALAQAYAWIAQALEELDGSGIVYCLTIAETERLAGFLDDRGHAVAAYSSATPPEQRLGLEGQLLAGKLKALVATSSLGMGLDMPHLAFVVHLGAPSSPISYYQQVGRAGRALDAAVGVLIPTPADENIWAYFDSTAFPPEATVRKVLDVLAADSPMSVVTLETEAGLRRTRLEALLKVLDVEGAVERVDGGWTVTRREWVYDRPRHDGVAAARRAERQVMRDYLAGSGCLMELLRRELDDPLAEPCGRCSVCTGRVPHPGTTPDEDILKAAKAHLRSQVTVLEPRKMWPSGAPRRGKIAQALRAEPGRALAVGDDDAAWSDVLAEFFTAGVVSDELMSGVVAALGKWGWPAGRPTWVTWVPSRKHGTQLAELARRVADVGRMQLAPALAADGSGYQADASTYTVAATTALARLSIASTPVPDGPVLLIDDVTRSGFTLTASAVLLREAGSGPVYPFAVHKRF